MKVGVLDGVRVGNSAKVGSTIGTSVGAHALANRSHNNTKKI